MSSNDEAPASLFWVKSPFGASAHDVRVHPEDIEYTRTPSSEYLRGIEDAARVADDPAYVRMVGGSTGDARGTAMGIAKAIRSLVPVSTAPAHTFWNCPDCQRPNSSTLTFCYHCDAPASPATVPKDCPSSNHPYRVHDWRWLGWPLDDPASQDATCDYCGTDRGRGDQTAVPVEENKKSG